MGTLGRFYILIILTLMGAVGCPAFMVYRDAHEELSNRLAHRQELLASSVKRELQLSLDNTRLLVDVLATSSNFRSFFDANEHNTDHVAKAQESLSKASKRHGLESILLLLDTAGKVLLVEPDAPMDGRNFSVPAAVVQALHGGASQMLGVNLDGKECIAFLAPVIVHQHYRGAVALVWQLNDVMRPWLGGGYVSGKQPLRVFLMHKDGRLLFRSEWENEVGRDLTRFPVGQLVISGKSGVLTYQDSRGEPRIGALFPVPELQWVVGVSSPLSSVKDASQALLFKAVVGALVFVSLAILLIWLSMHRMTKSLRQVVRQKEMIVQGAGMGVWDCDLSKGIFSFDARWAQVAGLPLIEDNVEPVQWLWGITHPDDRSSLASMGAVTSKEQRFNYELRILQSDGSWRWVQNWGQVTARDAQGKPMQLTGLSMDIDARKRMEQNQAEQKMHLEALVAQRTADLQKTRDEALAATEAKSIFLSTMSHEIRTPLNAVVGFIQLFERDNLRPRQLDYLYKIRTASHGLLNVINDVLDISKIEAGKLEVECVPFALRSVMDAVCSISGFAVKEKALELQVLVQDDVPDRLLGDPTRLHQVLLNLISNAVKFTHEGCISVQVCLAGEEVPLPPMEGHLHLYFEVRDTGLGMNDTQLQRLFKPFSQADSTVARKFGGTGLGLAICRQLVDLMGGVISATSQPGQGSVFRFYLPMQVDSTESGHALAGENSSSLEGLRGAKVLVVEDNTINQEIVRTQLEYLGLGVDVAENGQEAVDMALAMPYDLIFMDMRMPVMDGITATRCLRQLGAKAAEKMAEAHTEVHTALRTQKALTEVPIIAMTANAMSEDRRQCLDAGMDDHMVKPFVTEELQRVLLRWIRR